MNTNAFLDYAAQFRDAANQLSQSKSFQFKPAFYCAIHAVELAIKGHLIHSGISIDELRRRDLGHKLDKLLERALEVEALTDEMLDYVKQEAIQWASKDYSGKSFEYPVASGSTFAIGVWIEIADDLVEGLRQKLPDSPCTTQLDKTQ